MGHESYFSSEDTKYKLYKSINLYEIYDFANTERQMRKTYMQ